jgi:DNA repair exonuclease SbcCD ATPase subunit
VLPPPKPAAVFAKSVIAHRWAIVAGALALVSICILLAAVQHHHGGVYWRTRALIAEDRARDLTHSPGLAAFWQQRAHEFEDQVSHLARRLASQQQQQQRTHVVEEHLQPRVQQLEQLVAQREMLVKKLVAELAETKQAYASSLHQADQEALAHRQRQQQLELLTAHAQRLEQRALVAEQQSRQLSLQLQQQQQQHHGGHFSWQQRALQAEQQNKQLAAQLAALRQQAEQQVKVLTTHVAEAKDRAEHLKLNLQARQADHQACANGNVVCLFPAPILFTCQHQSELYRSNQERSRLGHQLAGPELLEARLLQKLTFASECETSHQEVLRYLDDDHSRSHARR